MDSLFPIKHWGLGQSWAIMGSRKQWKAWTALQTLDIIEEIEGGVKPSIIHKRGFSYEYGGHMVKAKGEHQNLSWDLRLEANMRDLQHTMTWTKVCGFGSSRWEINTRQWMAHYCSRRPTSCWETWVLIVLCAEHGQMEKKTFGG